MARMRNNMKGGELPMQDKLIAVIEPVNDELKNICPIKYIRQMLNELHYKSLSDY